MSEFYKLRRTKITDGMALLGFILGLLIPAYAAGKEMATGFEAGQEARGLTYFVVTILVNAVAGGVLGLLAGILTGWSWERVHRMLRSSRTSPEALASSIGSTSAPAQASARAVSEAGHDNNNIRYDASGFTSGEFITLLDRVMRGEYDMSRTDAALERSTNIGAWDGDRLVGAVRVLSDSYLFATIPEIVVDPDYQRRGIGRALMMRALDAAATGVILFGSPPDASGFFEHLGCQRAPSGYVLKRRVTPEVRTR